jgi:plasmid stabilization system protein ParE
VQVDPAAQAEIDAAMAWYEARSPGVGLDLLGEARHALERIAQYPDVGTPTPRVRTERGTRRLTLRRFPYAIVYRNRGDEIEVVAFAHHSRRPGYWRSR